MIGQAKGQKLTASLGSSKAYKMVQYIKDHIPNEADGPNKAMRKLTDFNAGRFANTKNEMLKAYGINPPPSADAGKPAAAPGGGSGGGKYTVRPVDPKKYKEGKYNLANGHKAIVAGGSMIDLGPGRWPAP